MKWRNWLNALIGAWFIVSPWALGYAGHVAAVWTSVILGAVQLIASAWVAWTDSASGWKTWQNWVSLIMGAWFIVQPFALSLTENTAELWSSLILGVITVILNLWEMGETESEAISRKNSHGTKAAT